MTVLVPSRDRARARRAAWLCLAAVALTALRGVGAPAGPALAPTPTAVRAPYARDFGALCTAVQDHFYDPALGGLDWPRVRAEYAGRLAMVQDDAQFRALMNALLARLRASHTRLYGPDDFEYYLLPEIVYGQIAPPQLGPRTIPQGVAARPQDRFRGGRVFGLEIPQIGCLPASADPAVVAAVLDGSPAAAAGLRAGDVLVSVDGRPYQGLTQFGRAPLRLVYRRAGVETAVTLTPVLQTPLELMLAATEKSVRVIGLPDGRKIGYLHLWCMGSGQFAQALEEAVTGRLHDTDGLVLDLRQGYGGSPGGYADVFFRPDLRVAGRSRQNPHWVPRHEGYTQPLVVLVDRGTRSAKEWLAFTLQASGRATLVGQRTAGAVLSLQIFPVGPPFLLELAVQDLTLNDVRLEGRGVTPDIAVTGAPSDDAYLKAALQAFARKRSKA